MLDKFRSEVFIVVFVTTLVQALVTMIVVIPAAIAPEFAAALDLPPSMVGMQIGVTYGGAMVLSTVSGTFVKRWGALRSSQMALAFALIGATLMTVPMLPVIALGAIVCGFGYALTNPPASHLLQKITAPKDRNFIFSIKQTSVPIGGIAAGVMAPPVALAYGWQAPLMIGGGVILLVICLMQPLRRGWDSDRSPGLSIHHNPFADMAIMWGDIRLRLFAFAAFFYSAMQLCLTTFAVALLVSDLKFGLVEAGLILAVLQVGGVAGRVIWGWLADRVRDGNAVLLVIATISTAAALATTQLSPNTAEIYIYGLFTLFSFAAVGWNGIAMAEIARLAPTGLISAATGSVLVITFAGILIGPPVFTGLYSIIGTYTGTFGIFAAVSAIGFLFVMAARWRER
jgi:MFS family permease